MTGRETDAVKILHKRYIAGNPEREASLQEERELNLRDASDAQQIEEIRARCVSRVPNWSESLLRTYYERDTAFLLAALHEAQEELSRQTALTTEWAQRCAASDAEMLKMADKAEQRLIGDDPERMASFEVERKLSPMPLREIEETRGVTSPFVEEKPAVTVPSRPGCPFSYCDNPESCQAMGMCRHSEAAKGWEPCA